MTLPGGGQDAGVGIVPADVAKLANDISNAGLKLTAPPGVDGGNSYVKTTVIRGYVEGGNYVLPQLQDFAYNADFFFRNCPQHVMRAAEYMNLVSNALQGVDANSYAQLYDIESKASQQASRDHSEIYR